MAAIFRGIVFFTTLLSGIFHSGAKVESNQKCEPSLRVSRNRGDYTSGYSFADAEVPAEDPSSAIPSFVGSSWGGAVVQNAAALATVRCRPAPKYRSHLGRSGSMLKNPSVCR